MLMNLLPKVLEDQVLQILYFLWILVGDFSSYSVPWQWIACLSKAPQRTIYSVNIFVGMQITLHYEPWLIL